MIFPAVAKLIRSRGSFENAFKLGVYVSRTIQRSKLSGHDVSVKSRTEARHKTRK